MRIYCCWLENNRKVNNKETIIKKKQPETHQHMKKMYVDTVINGLDCRISMKIREIIRISNILSTKIFFICCNFWCSYSSSF